VCGKINTRLEADRNFYFPIWINERRVFSGLRRLALVVSGYFGYAPKVRRQFTEILEKQIEFEKKSFGGK